MESLPEVLDESAREVLSLRRRQLAAMLAARDPDAAPLPESLSDTEFVAVASNMYKGVPASGRMSFKIEKDGLFSVSSDLYHGAKKGVRNFEGSYTRIKK